MLKASELRKTQKEKSRRAKENYKRLLEDCSNRIKSTNSKGSTTYIYRLNGLIVDMPLIDVPEALQYISRKLKRGGFKVAYTAANTILIDWSK